MSNDSHRILGEDPYLVSLHSSVYFSGVAGATPASGQGHQDQQSSRAPSEQSLKAVQSTSSSSARKMLPLDALAEGVLKGHYPAY